MGERLRRFLRESGRPFGVLIAGLLLATAFTAWSGVWHHQHELAGRVDTPETAETTPGKQVTPLAANISTETVLAETTPQTTPSHGSSTKPATAKRQQAGPSQNTSPSVPAPNQTTQATVTVSLRVNDSSRGQVTLPVGNNHCSVLTAALQNGQISSLDMRYNQQYGSYGVYVIDGVGDSSTVWWTYQINGASPPYGCSHQKVRDGESVHWKYIKG